MKEKFKIYDLSNQRFTASTVLGEFEGQKITVSQMMIAVETYIKYIKDHFDINKKAYSMTLIALKSLRLHLLNQSADKPTAEQLKCVVDVLHEIADMRMQSDVDKQKNDKTASELKMLINFWENIQKEPPK